MTRRSTPGPAPKTMQYADAVLLGSLTAAADVVMVVDRAGHYVKIAPQYADLLEALTASLPTATLQSTFPSPESAMILSQVRQALETRKAAQFDCSSVGGPVGGWYDATVIPVLAERALLVARKVTQARLAEDAAKRFSRVVEQTTDSVVIPNRNGIIEYVNPAFEQITGYSQAEVIGQNPRIIKSGRHRAAFFHRLWDQILAGRTFHDVLINRRKSGELFYEEKTITPLKNEAGTTTHFVATAKEITGRHVADLALRASEARYCALLEAMPDLIFHLRRDGTILEHYAENEDLLVIAPSAFVGRRVTEIFPPEIAAKIMHAIARATETRRVATLDYKIEHPNGTLYNQARIVACEDNELIAIVRDSTERVQMAEALKTSEEHYRALVEHTPDVISRFDREGRYLFVNRAVERVSRLAPAAFIGKTHAELGFPPDRVAVWESAIQRVFETKEPYETETDIEGPDGLLNFNWRLFPEFDAGGNVQSVLSISRDITEQKRCENDRIDNLARSVVMNSVSQALTAVSMDYEQALDLIVENAAALFGDGAILTLISEDGESARPVAAHHPDPARAAYVKRLLNIEPYPVRSTVVGRLLMEGKPQILKVSSPGVAGAALRPEYQSLAAELGVNSLLMVPMQVHGRVIGSLTLARYRTGQAHTLQDQIFLRTLADRAALTIHNARLFTENKRQSDQLRQANIELEQRIAERTEELVKANERLMKLTVEDALTGLANRRRFDTSLELEIRRARREGEPLSLFMCDVDFFKRYNDHYGHIAGDKCLQRVADMLRTTFKRASDLPTRYGGEEFSVILPGTDGAGAKVAAERVRQAMMALGIVHEWSDVAANVTLSIGAVTLLPGKDAHATDLIRKADEALYRSKANGRNRVTWVSLP